ncbi:N-acetyl-alpha-D-glucosaminyl L-malate synthase BshA [uncultured Clostridium sp.]|nr:N-acetyl-alpha-D-glucosaminyl L-malate synthase BshA [uncultured Clostridium sp.]
MILITPSQWLADLVKQSFLKEYSIEVHYNTIDTDIFKPTPSNFREKYGLQEKVIVLGVANVWEERKGLFDFYKLEEMLDDRYVVVLVGLNDKQIKKLPSKIVGIKRTNSPKELAEIYTAADVFVNASVEETFGMTTVEADACGTLSIVYEDTACAEIARVNHNLVVKQGVENIYKAISSINSEDKKQKES